jgi:hypothetical protein
MKKITILILSVLFTLTTSAFAGGMIGVKYGKGDLEGNAKAYGQYNAQSASKDSDFGAIFAEVNIKESPISVGIEYVPLDADISLDGHQANVSANVSDYTTLYALAMHDLTNFSVYGKLGYSHADIGKVKVNDFQTTYVSQAGDLEGMMYGVGIQSQELPYGLVARAEYTLTEFDDVSVTTTSNGSATTKKTADGELTTLTFSLAKSF